MTGLGLWVRRGRAVGILAGCVAGWVFAACGSDTGEDRAKLAKIAEGCLIDSDCATPLVCAFKTCHSRCNDSRDCPDEEVCVPADPRPYNVCLHSPNKCVYNTDCPSEQLFCAADSRCRLQCKADRDCLPEQKCIQGACADDKDIEDGGLVDGGTDLDASIGTSCTYNTDCPAPLVCKAGSCLVECKGDRDCPPGLFCSAAGACVTSGPGDGGTDGPVVVPGCANGKQDPGETGVDCGGSCGACDGSKCSKPSDCASNVCKGLVCQAPSCGDGLQNGIESDVDCGGGCPKCPPTKGCWTSNDCTTGSCVNGSCNAPGCSNGQKDTNETDVDCGGTECAPCATGKACAKNEDCSSQNCVSKKCVNAGPTLWTRVLSSAGSSELAHVAAAGTTHVVAAGAGTNTLDLGGGPLLLGGYGRFAAKYTVAGAHVWSRALGGSNVGSFGDVAVGPSGAVWVWANSQLTAPEPGGLASCQAFSGKPVALLTKLDASTGATVWSTCAGISDSGQFQAQGVTVDAQGDVWASGRFYGTADFDGIQPQSPYLNGFLVKYSGVSGQAAWVSHLRNDAAPPGSLASFGEVTDTSTDATHGYVVGSLTHNVKIGTGAGVLLTKVGSQDDILVAKLDTNGAAVQTRVIGSTGKDQGMHIRVVGSDVWIAGEFAGQVDFGSGHVITAAGGRDIFVARLSATDLSTQFAQAFGATTDEDLGGFDVAANGEFTITGAIRSAHNFGGGPLPYSGGTDFFLARYSSSGVHQSSFGAGGISSETGTSAAYVGSGLLIAGQYSSSVTIDFGTGPFPVPPQSTDAFLVFFP
ncbi:MAG: hypothetical protein R3B13_32410 [Polyangiaceae bacterium]